MTTTLLPTTTTTSTTPEITTTSTTETPSSTSPSPETNPCLTQEDIDKKQTELNDLIFDEITLLTSQKDKEEKLKNLKIELNDYYTFIEFFKIGGFEKPVPIKFNQGKKKLDYVYKIWKEIFIEAIIEAELPEKKELFFTEEKTFFATFYYITDFALTYDFTKFYPFYEDAYEAQQEVIRLRKALTIAQDYSDWFNNNDPNRDPNDERNIYNKMDVIYSKINNELPGLEAQINLIISTIKSNKNQIKKLTEEILLDKRNKIICELGSPLIDNLNNGLLELEDKLNLKDESRRILNYFAPKLIRY